MRVFITGATGFIGRRLVKRLSQNGDNVTALVRAPSHGLPLYVKAVHGDLLKPETYTDALKEIDCIYHLAGLITFDPKKRKDLLHINGQGTRLLLNQARAKQVRRCLIVSSACTRGISHSPGQMLDETATAGKVLIKSNPYLESKLAAEREALLFTDTQEVIIVNPTTVFGPGDYSLNSGTLTLAVAKAPIVPVPPGGSNVVDVDDVVLGIIAAAQRGKNGRSYILGGENLLFYKMFQLVEAVADSHTFFIPLPRKFKIPAAISAGIFGRITGNRFLTAQIIEDLFAYKYYTSYRARNELDWTPRFSFRDTLERAWDFYKKAGLA